MARTTLIIPDALWREVKLRTANENRTISDWIADAIRLKIQAAGRAPSPPKVKFDEVWISKPGGADLPYPLTRDAIYDPSERA